MKAKWFTNKRVYLCRDRAPKVNDNPYIYHPQAEKDVDFLDEQYFWLVGDSPEGAAADAALYEAVILREATDEDWKQNLGQWVLDMDLEETR
jgi:hypothetical protein